MISFDEALNAVLASAEPLAGAESVPIESCLGRYLAEDVVAQVNVPGFDNSAMDGYAVATSSVEVGRPMLVLQRIPAGVGPKDLSPNTAARIFTGACVPQGADAVILQEDATLDAEGRVSFTEAPAVGQHIRLSGQDLEQGDVVARAGRRLTAADVGLIASVGVANVLCSQKIKVAFFSTGDELQVPGKPLEGAQIYNSNRYMLMACLRELGMEPIDLSCCEDSPQATRAMLQMAGEAADVVLTTGGMSVGEEDYVRSAAEALGELEFWKIAMKPGKPFAMGEVNGAKFFGLPGNPVSTFVTFQLLVKPWLLKQAGAKYLPKKFAAVARFEKNNRGGRVDFVRARVILGGEGKLEADIFSNQSSGVLSSIVYANALIPVPPKAQINRGEWVEAWMLGDIEF